MLQGFLDDSLYLHLTNFNKLSGVADTISMNFVYRRLFKESSYLPLYVMTNVTGFMKTGPNRTGTEIHFIA